MTLSFRALAIGSVVHALGVLLIWALVVFAERQLISTRWWLAIAWLWLAWWIPLAFHPAGNPKRVGATILTGFVILLPCLYTVYVVTYFLFTGQKP